MGLVWDASKKLICLYFCFLLCWMLCNRTCEHHLCLLLCQFYLIESHWCIAVLAGSTICFYASRVHHQRQHILWIPDRWIQGDNFISLFLIFALLFSSLWDTSAMAILPRQAGNSTFNNRHNMCDKWIVLRCCNFNI